jgi:hypothetical protein
MAFYASKEELDDIMMLLWEKIRVDQDMSSKLLASKLIVKFNYREPDGHMTVDCSDGQEMKISVGNTETKPIVEMFMRADVAHEFWLGRVNVPVAILSGKIVSKGPTNRALALLPVLKPAYALYPPIYEKIKAKSSSQA